MTTKDDRAPFLSRWSRLKEEAREEPARSALAKQDETQPAPELPPVDELNFDSDFKAFMDKRVDPGLRRIALKKLFSDPRFNVTDGLDDYAEDYSALEDLSQAAVDNLQHARRTLHGPEPDETAQPETAQPETAQPKTPETTEKAAAEPQAPAAEPAAAPPHERLETAEGHSAADETGTPVESGDKDERTG